MENKLPLEECNINQIYFDSQESIKYTIPVYQRNYAWEEDEIKALVQDIYDSSEKDSSKPYYIGTLVTYKRGDNIYEVIDGQQRLTTIFIILKALGYKNEDFKNKLTYSARTISASTIEKLENHSKLDEEDKGIVSGYKYAQKAIEEILGNNSTDDFEKYFLNNVHIIHYNVPQDVDLNHYFEVMNSRGEQLEKHEIIKSILCQKINNEKDIAKFSRVWEACTKMNIYIQQAFSEREKDKEKGKDKDEKIFGNKLEDFIIKDFDAIPEYDKSDGKETILDLLKSPIGEIKENQETEQTDKFQPIIDFPNLLLIVLKITRMKEKGFNPLDFILDDKELLREFGKALKDNDNKAKFAKDFCYNLLKARYYLDNCIIHHSITDKDSAGDNPWKLQYFHQDSPKRKYPKNLEEDERIQYEMVHLLSMFEVTFTPKQRKNYLFYCLLFLFNNETIKTEDYLEFLQYMADKYFYDIYLNDKQLSERNQPGPNAFDSIILKNGELNVYDFIDYDSDYKEVFNKIYQQGRMDIPLYVFNYTDYILWKKYADELRGNKTKKGDKARTKFFEDLGCNDFGLETFDEFYFSRTRKSLEHFYPQAKAGDDQPLTDIDINCFGNFAMIGAEANSSGSNWDPRGKLDHYCDRKSDPVSVASLKFKIMLQMCEDNEGHRSRDMQWNAEDIQKHQEKMLDIIIA